MTLETIRFFEKAPLCLPLYESFEEVILSRFPDTAVRTLNTQIAFDDPRPFVYVSLPRRKVREAADAHLIITIGLAYRLESDRVWHTSEPYPNRWTHHIILRPDGLDEALLSLIAEAHAFSHARRVPSRIRQSSSD